MTEITAGVFKAVSGIHQAVQSVVIRGWPAAVDVFIGAGAVQTTGDQGQMREGEGNAISMTSTLAFPTTAPELSTKSWWTFMVALPPVPLGH